MSSHSNLEIAVFPVFSFGTRMLPLTYEHPKELLAVGNRTLLHWAMREAQLAGIEKFVLIVLSSTDLHPFGLSADYKHKLGSLGKLAERWPNQYQETVLITREWLQLLEKVVAYVPLRFDLPAGFAQAIQSVEPIVKNSPFAFFLPDDYIGNPKCGMPALLDTWKMNHGWAMSLFPIAPDKVDEFGVVRVRPFDKGPTGCLQVTCAREKRALEGDGPLHAIVGRYIFDNCIFNIIRESQEDVLKEQSQSGNHITEAIHRYALRGKAFGLCLDESFFHAGTPQGYYNAWRHFLAEHDRKP